MEERLTPAGQPHIGDAVLFDVRTLSNLPTVLHSARRALPNSWLVHFLHGERNAASVLSAHGLRQDAASGMLVLRALASIVPEAWLEMVCRNHTVVPHLGKDPLQITVLKSPLFWSAFSAEKLLLMQPDSAFCPKPSWPLERFLHLTWVGAPWSPCVPKPGWSCVGNSGFSIWSRRVVLNLTRTGPPIARHGAFSNWDLWAALRLQSPGVRYGDEPIVVPNASEAALFSVESVYKGGYTPIGFHRPWGRLPRIRGGGQKLLELQERCPLVARLANKTVGPDLEC